MLIAEVTLLSIGEAARLLGASLEELVVAAEDLNIRAAERRDGVPYLYGDDVQRIREHLESQK